MYEMLNDLQNFRFFGTDIKHFVHIHLPTDKVLQENIIFFL